MELKIHKDVSLNRRSEAPASARQRALRPPPARGHVLALRFSPQLSVTPGESTVAVSDARYATVAPGNSGHGVYESALTAVAGESYAVRGARHPPGGPRRSISFITVSLLAKIRARTAASFCQSVWG